MTAILTGTGMVFRIMLTIVQIFPTVTKKMPIMTDWVRKSDACISIEHIDELTSKVVYCFTTYR